MAGVVQEKFMKIISIIGSPRGEKGNTSALLNLVLAGAKNQGAEVESIFIRGQEVQPCRACNSCHKTGLCPQKDEFKEIKDKLLKSDGIILGSPDYIFNVSAQLKAFLDRCCGLVHCLALKGKYGASVVTSGGGDGKAISEYLNRFLASTGAMSVGSVCATMSKITGTDFPMEIREKAFTLGENLVKAWRNQEVIEDYVKIFSEFQERMRNLILWRKQEWTYEYEYWKKHYGLE